MGKFTRQLMNMIPRTGRLIKEDGAFINEADVLTGQASKNIWPFGETLVGSKRDDMSLQYQYNYINTDFDFRPPVVTGDGLVVQENSMLQLSSTTGSASIESLGATSYRPGHSGYLDFTASFTGSGSAVIGGKNAFQLRYNNGSLSFGYIKGGSFVGVPVDIEGLDLNALNIYRIVYGYLGSASPILFVKKGNYRQIAIVETEGVIDSTHVDDPNFTAYHEVSGDCLLKSGSYAAGIINGGEDVNYRAFTFPNSPLVDGTGVAQGDMTLTGYDVGTVVVFKAKDIYKGSQNTVRAFLANFVTYVDDPETGSGSVIFQIIANPTLTGTPSYADIDPDNSIMAYDHTAGTGASVDYAGGGRVILQSQVAYAAGQGNVPGVANITDTDAQAIGATAQAGDVFAIIAKDKDGNGVTIRSSASWKERF